LKCFLSVQKGGIINLIIINARTVIAVYIIIVVLIIIRRHVCSI
jgi:hypothetical protein